MAERRFLPAEPAVDRATEDRTQSQRRGCQADELPEERGGDDEADAREHGSKGELVAGGEVDGRHDRRRDEEQRSRRAAARPGHSPRPS